MHYILFFSSIPNLMIMSDLGLILDIWFIIEVFESKIDKSEIKLRLD